MPSKKNLNLFFQVKNTIPSFSLLFCCQEARIFGATFRDSFQVKGIIFRSFSAQETIDSVWPMNKKNPSLWLHFCSHSAAHSEICSKPRQYFSVIISPKKPAYLWGPSAENIPSWGHHFLVLISPRNYLFCVVYVQKNKTFKIGVIIFKLSC